MQVLRLGHEISRRGAPLALLLLSSVALGAPKLLVAASGDCQDPDLVTDLRLVSKALQLRSPGRVLDEATVRERIEPAATSSLKDIELQLQTAQSLFYNGSYSRSERQLDSALAEVRRLPPGSERWNLQAMLLAYRSLTLKHQGRLRESSEANREILRVQSGYQLDRDQFAPQTHRFFEETRKEVAHTPRVKLEVTSEPSGATVFLDGYGVGKTPYASERVPGNYQVIVVKEGRTSLRHTVELGQPVHLSVDLAFEGAISPQRLACVREGPNQTDALGPVLKLAMRTNAEELILLRLDHLGGVGPGWLRASVVQVGPAQTVREGAIKVLPGVSPPEGLEDLVTFLLTGQPSRAVVPAQQLPAPRLASASTGSGGASPEAALQPAASLSTGRPRTLSSTLGWGLAGAGVVLVGVGAFLEIQGSSQWGSFNQYYANGSPGPAPADAAKVDSLRSTARMDQTLGWVGMAIGAASLGAGSLLLAHHHSSDVALQSVGVLLTNHGASASLAVQLP